MSEPVRSLADVITMNPPSGESPAGSCPPLGAGASVFYVLGIVYAVRLMDHLAEWLCVRFRRTGG